MPKKVILKTKLKKIVTIQKKLWQQFKNLGNNNKQKESTNIVLEIDKEITHDAEKIVNHFNTFSLVLLSPWLQNYLKLSIYMTLVQIFSKNCIEKCSFFKIYFYNFHL